MSTYDESISSGNEGVDTSNAVENLQKRICKLKTDRDDQMRAVVQDTAAAINEIRARYADAESERQEEENVRRAGILQQLEKSFQRQVEIEHSIETILRKRHQVNKNLEDMLQAAYEGRAEDVKKRLSVE